PGSNLAGLEVGHLDFQRVHEMEIIMPPGIQALAEDAPVQYGLSVQAKAAGRARGEDLLRIIKLQPYVIDLDRHGEMSLTTGSIEERWASRGSASGGHGSWSRRGDRSEANQGDVIDLDMVGGVFADILEDGASHGFRPARGLGHPAQQARVLTRVVQFFAQIPGIGHAVGINDDDIPGVQADL